MHLLKSTTKKRKRRPELEEEKIEKESSKRKLGEFDRLAQEYHQQQEQIVSLQQTAFDMQNFIAQQQEVIATHEQ